jgi:hypothetical protein
MMGTTCVKLNPESTTTIQSGGDREGWEKRVPKGINDAAVAGPQSSGSGYPERCRIRTRAPIIRLELIFLKHELVIDLL